MRRCGKERGGRVGSWWPGISLAVLATAVTLASTGRPALAQEKKLPVAEEVLDKAIEALGGKAAMEKQHTRVSKGTFVIPAAGQKGTLASFEAAPDKYYQTIEMSGGMKVESGTDGEVYWVLTRQGPRILEGEDKALKARDSRFNALLYWRSLYKTAACTGVEDVDGHPCYKVVLTPELGPAQTYYYDCQSYLARRMDLTLKGPRGPAPTEIRFDDYKKVDGVLVPHKITQTTLGIEQVVSFDTIESNVAMPADRFAIPEAVKALLEEPKTTTRPAAPAPEKVNGAGK
jgi:hypothetical protein